MRPRLAFVWHMHQPVYVDPFTGESILPWVRLHATRAYYDMGRALEAHPRVQATVNFAPSLVRQLDALVRGESKDRFADLSALAPGDLTPRDRQQLVRHFFMVSWETGVKPMTRYWELLNKRGLDVKKVDLEEVARAFDDGELRDLQVLFNLAWMGFSAREELPEVAALAKKGRNFTEAEKAALLAAQRELCARVLPLWRRLSERGQVELTATPLNHPILPLLCDSDAARRAMPNAELPPRFSWPDDARTQVRRALELHERHFGARPRGMWPAEGSVSPEALAIFAEEGVAWVASDEGVLRQSKPRERATRPGALYQPWRVAAGSREISMVFRDHRLSDLVGFTYAKNAPAAAAADLVAHVASAPPGSLVTVILDGENAWEHYANSGRDFLRALYGRLEANGCPVETRTVSGALAETPPQGRLDEIHSGSWIDANYRIWIGHPEDNTAWAELGKARARLAEKQAAGGLTSEAYAEALDLLLIAEGSDWFWWYGDDFATETKAEFDALFRRHVERAWLAMGEPPPSRLAHPIATVAEGAGGDEVQEPTALIHPVLDGRGVAYFEWSGAGLVRATGDHGSMHRGPSIFRALRYGFDLENLYLRLDPAEGFAVAQGAADVARVSILTDDGERTFDLPLRGGAPTPPVRLAVGDILEAALPFSLLGLAPRAEMRLAMRVLKGDVEVERLPRQGFVALAVPDLDFERVHWSV